LRDGCYEDHLIVTFDTAAPSFQVPEFWLHILFHRLDLVVEWSISEASTHEFGKRYTSEIVSVEDGTVVRFQVETSAGPVQVDANGLCIHILRRVFALQGLPLSLPNAKWPWSIAPATSARATRNLAEPLSPQPQQGQAPTQSRPRKSDGIARETGTRKGDVSLLQKADRSLYQSVDFPTAEEYLGLSERRRQQLVREGTLKALGKGQNRRITVESLLQFFPPADDAK
jgi:hypothetical protein